jgi:hypothetical protein
MSPIPDDFEQLRRLLALKRHEQPPPGYFYGFSRQVIVRIKAGELGDGEEVSSWSFGGGLFQRMWATLDARPILAGAFGVAVCGFFVVGALVSDNASSAIANQLPTQPSPFVAQAGPIWQQTKVETEFPSTLGDSAPTYQPADYQPPADSLFEQLRKKQASPKSFPETRLTTPGMPVQVSYPVNQ